LEQFVERGRKARMAKPKAEEPENKDHQEARVKGGRLKRWDKKSTAKAGENARQ
jgi:hypothetical protein